VADVVCWLMLIYRVPSEPSRLRTAVWRRLKALGAVYVANSVAVLPESPEAGRALRAEVEGMGGAAHLIRAEPLTGQADFTALSTRRGMRSTAR
jgi:DNA-binding transcriptional regulator PaaX